MGAGFPFLGNDFVDGNRLHLQQENEVAERVIIEGFKDRQPAEDTKELVEMLSAPPLLGIIEHLHLQCGVVLVLFELKMNEAVAAAAVEY